MAMNAQQTVIGVFDERGPADRTVADLENAGFRSDQIYFSGSGENPRTNFWGGITGFFTHDRTSTHDDLTKDLKDFDLSDDEIRHYDSEYHLGKTIVAVKSPDRRDEALAIMRTNGAHN